MQNCREHADLIPESLKRGGSITEDAVKHMPGRQREKR